MADRKQVASIFVLILLVLFAYASFQIAKVFIDFLLLALFLGFTSHPMYEWLNARIKRKNVAAFATSVIVTAIVVVPLTLLTIQLVSELTDIVKNLNASVVRTQFDALAGRLFTFFGAEYQSDAAAGSGLLAILIPSLNDMATSVSSNLVGALAKGVVGAFVLLYVLYYSYVDGNAAVRTVRDILPMARAHTDKLFREVGQVLKAVLYGTVLTALVQAVLAGIGYAIFGVPNVVFWSAMTFVFALLPIIGPPIIWFPWSIVLLLQDHTFAGVGLLIYSAIMVSTLDNFLRPKLIGDRARIHPVVILIGVLGGVAVFGFTGFLLGPLILAMFLTIVQLYRSEFASSARDNTLTLELDSDG
jgi:predicted PurR-regulated permease PerM